MKHRYIQRKPFWKWGKANSKKEETNKYLSGDYIPVIKASICNGEQVAGFKEKRTGHFEEIMLIRSERDLQDFKEQYGIETVKKEY